MKNPGAANFKRPDHAAINSPEELKQLSVFDDGELRADWYEFSSDPTMECIGRLFSEYYAAKGELLEGVIQIFNLFYLREANLITALNKVSQLNLANMADYDVQHLTFPVYLGFADLAWHKTYGIVARSKCYYNDTNQDAPNEYLYRDILSDYGFDTEKNIGNNVWLARKAFKEYGSDERDVTRNILEELKNLRNRFNHMKIVGNNNNHMNKKIYFAGSIRGGRVDTSLYQRMIDYIKQTDTVLTEHIGKTNMSLKAQTKAIDIHIYERDIEWLKQSDMVIAECTCPSLGVGYELAYAEAHNIPVYIFYDKSNANISAMLNGNEYFNIIPYESEDEIYHNLDNILHC